MNRTVSGTLIFAILAILAPSLLSWVAYRGLSQALRSEFERRLEGLAASTASQIGAADVRDAHLFGEEGAGYGQLQVQLEELKATTGLANASLVDSTGAIVYDCRGAEFAREITPLDTLARDALRQALQGRSLVSAPFVRGGRRFRAGLAPVLGEGGHVAGVVAVEAREDYLPTLADIRRTLLLATALIALAIAVLAALRIRVAIAGERLERRLARSETLAAMGRLTATLAHEIKNPLAIIRGSAQRLGKLEPEARRMADFIVEESDRLSETVSRYLQFARGGEARPGAGDAVAALDATLGLLEGEVRARHSAVERSGETAPIGVPLDNESLKQIYLNLILNALEAMPEGGAIRAHVAVAGNEVQVRIADEGPGLPPEHLQMPGSAFWTTKAQGSGLGLFLSRRLAQSAGGELTLKNADGRGAVATLRLPRRKEETS